MEGVMMRGKTTSVVSVRREDGSIATVSEPLDSFYTGRPREIPFIRGMVVLTEALVLGMKSILVSAREYAGPAEQPAGRFFWVAVVVGLLLAVGLFFVLPLLVLQFFDRYIASSLVSNLLEGMLRLALFLGYLKLIASMEDIKRVFAYHGAEHKVVNAFEAGAPLEVPEVAGFSTAHARCGTSFTLVVLVLAILVFALLGRPSMAVRVASRIVLVPVIAALGYEFVRYAASHTSAALVRMLLAPGLALQSLTTRQPDAGQIEVALAAFKKVLEDDGPAPL